MRRDSRLFYYAPLVVIGVLALAWRIFWNAGADEMRSAMRRAADRLTSLGVVMTYDPLEAHGFPLALKGIVENVSFSGPRRRANADLLHLDVSILHLDRLQLRANRFEISGDGEFWTIDGAMRAYFLRDAKRDWVVRADAREITALRGGRLWEIDALTLESGPDESEKARIRNSFKITGARLRDTRATIDSAEATFDIEPTRVGDAAEAAARDIRVHAVMVRFDGAVLKASGTVRLAPGGDVAGRFNGCIDKPEKLAKLAAEIGAITADEARTAARALRYASRLTADGALCAPILMREGAVRIAGVAFAKY